MGLYSSDTARLGALADITLSAALLVVDTGINAFGWTREQGIAYIRDHTRVPRLRAAVPVDRYPIWPAQGLSYALGRLEIRRLRASPDRRLVGGRRPRDGAGSARAGPEAGRCAACLLLARDVRPPGDERSERRHVVARRNRADLFDAGLALAATNRLARRAAADGGRGVRLPAPLVPPRTARCALPGCARARPPAARR